MKDDLRISLPGVPASFIAALVKQAKSAGSSRLALVGGAVRDAMLHQLHRDPWRDLPDLDFLLEGSCAAFVECVQEHYGSERVLEVHLHE